MPTSGHELDAFLGKALDERPLLVVLWESIRDVFFPVKLPPLELTSEPIPVPDRMAVKPNPWAIGISTTVNLAILCVLLFFLGRKVIEAVKPSLLDTNIDVGEYQGPQMSKMAGGGGGGGDRSPIEANKGKLPERSPDPITPVAAADHRASEAARTAEHQRSEGTATARQQYADDRRAQLVERDVGSAGTGSGAGMGTGSGGGLGSGQGNGYGPGYGGNTGGGVYQVGGGISKPILIHEEEAEFSDEARRAKYQGVCLISLIVDAQGNPQNIHVIRTLGMGLDEKAIEAVRKYKFKPALKDGKTPVPVIITVEVDFHLY